MRRLRRMAEGVAAIVLVLILPGLAAGDGIHPRLPRAGQNHLWYVANDSDTVVIFVHGIFSDSRSAWLSDKGTYWPRMVAEDPRLGQPAIYLGGFHTALDSGTYNIRDAANELYQRLSLDDVFARKKLLFIAHSTGGIVVRHLLVRKREELADKTIGLMLMASPSIGARDAKRLGWLSELAANRMSIELAWDHPFLDELDREFKDLVYARRIPCLRGVEAVEHHLIGSTLFGLLRREVLVEMSSAGRYFGDPQRLAGTNHFTAVKPDSEGHPAHALLQHFFRSDFVRPCAAAVPAIERYALETSVETLYAEVGGRVEVPLRMVRLATGDAPPGGFTLRTRVRDAQGALLDAESAFSAFIIETPDRPLPPLRSGVQEQATNASITVQEAGRFRLGFELLADNARLARLEVPLVVDSLPFAELAASGTPEQPHFVLRDLLLTLERDTFDDYNELAVTLVDEAYLSNLHQATIYLDPTFYGSTGPTFDIYRTPLPEGEHHRGYDRDPIGTTFSSIVPIGASFYAFEQIDRRRLRFIPVDPRCQPRQLRVERIQRAFEPDRGPLPDPYTEIAISSSPGLTRTLSILGSEETFSVYYDCGANGAACSFAIDWGGRSYAGYEDYGALNLAESELPILREADRGAFWMLEARQADRYDTRLQVSLCQPRWP